MLAQGFHIALLICSLSVEVVKGEQGVMCAFGSDERDCAGKEKRGINECQSSPCRNGGECRDLVNDYYCKCMQGFRGKNCEIIACKPGLCVFGTCRNLPNGYRCDCTFGFKGQRCLEEAKGCELSPCQNDGICVGLHDGYRCECLTGFTGAKCELLYTPEMAVKVGVKGKTLPADSIGGILIISLGCLVIIAAISAGRSAGGFKSYGMLLRQWLKDLKRRRSSMDKQATPATKSGANVSVEQGGETSAERKSVGLSQQQ
ncbi:EGF domain containing protein [Trichuris trichiura]|uniref:EGF domain containing protein n=1 Tax=Trichuris trichiura TaxID=36087 RepID=A0A077Z9I0_TRITR|nr:EGF domain containing protein [Trichuris trichiura]